MQLFISEKDSARIFTYYDIFLFFYILQLATPNMAACARGFRNAV